MPTTYVGTIATIAGLPLSGLWLLCFEDGRMCYVESGIGVRALARCFGATEGSGDLQDKVCGQRIVYSVDAFGVLMGFTPVDEWEGPEIPDEGLYEDLDACEPADRGSIAVSDARTKGETE